MTDCGIYKKKGKIIHTLSAIIPNATFLYAFLHSLIQHLPTEGFRN